MRTTPHDNTNEETMEPIVRISRFSYSETVSRLGIEIARAGATLSCKLDQSSAAKAAGRALRPTTLFIFANTTAATELIAATPLAALDLPLKLLVWEENGVVRVAFVPALVIAERYNIASDDPVVIAMDALLQQVVLHIAAATPGRS